MDNSSNQETDFPRVFDNKGVKDKHKSLSLFFGTEFGLFVIKDPIVSDRTLQPLPSPQKPSPSV